MYPNDTTNEIPYGYCQCGCGQKTPIVTHTDRRFGYVKGKPQPYVNAGHKKHKSSQSTEEYFWNRVNKAGPDECWEWTAGIDGSGYGVMGIGSSIDGTKAVCKAHRFSYELHKEPIPEDLFCLHSCDNPKCVNPSHLWLGTLSDNVQDMLKKGRYNRTIRARGESNSKAKLTEIQVLEIRAKYSKGNGVRALMAEYGVGKSTLEHIISRRHWKHI